jgi:tetratricopeptide (TPR) repeat protein
MSRPLSFLLAAAVLLAVASCAAHEKAGDRAAAVGDWKTAEREYGAAARKDPSKRELQEKYAQARGAAIEGSSRAATACYAARDFECALAEASYALALDPGRVDVATLRRDAGREAAFQRVSRAREVSGRGDHRGALALLLSAREASDDPAVAAEIRRAAPGVVDGAVFDAEALRAKEQYPQALELYSAAAQLDPAVQPRLAVVQAEYERWKDSEAERLAQQGDGLLAERRYAEAKASYDAAVQLRPRGRAEPLARYTGLLAQGEAAIGARDFASAERAFAEASRYPGDRVAAEELDRVRVRPWAIRLDSVLVTPTRPDGWPWSGSRSFLLDRILAQLQRAAGSASASVALDLARRVPRDNQPNLVVTVGLPDGRGLQTAPRRGVHLALDGSFVVASNAYDDRQLSLRVVHEDARGGQAVDVGVVTFRLGDLVAQRELAVSGAEFNPAIRDRKRFRFAREILLGNRWLVDELTRNSEDIVQAATLPMLVERMNALNGDDVVDFATVESAVTAYDAAIRRGKRFHNDEQLRRIAWLRRWPGDRLRTCAFQPIVDRGAGPLMAIREHIISRKSLGGIQTDLASRVLGDHGQAIDGLYAAGEAAGFGGGGMNGKRGLEGTFLGGCVFSGRIAGQNA